MYVCLCKGITESDVMALADTLVGTTGAHNESTLERISSTLGLGTGCGSCLEFAGDLVTKLTADHATAGTLGEIRQAA